MIRLLSSLENPPFLNAIITFQRFYPFSSFFFNIRLEVAFWQQHPRLQNMCGFLVEEIQKACLAHLRNQVAESVRQLWSRVALLRAECEERVSVGRHENSLNASASVSTGMNASRSPGAIVQDIVKEICVRLEVEKEAVHTAAVRDASAFLHSFIDTHMARALPELCALYPCHVRVTSLAVWLIRNQAAEQHAALLSFMSSYARRKLGEVSGISAKQLKNVTGALSIPLGRVAHQGETDAGNESPSREVNLALKGGSSTSSSSGSIKRKSEGRFDAINSCFKDIQIFFTTDQQSDCSSDENLPTTPLDLCAFVSKHLNIRCTATQPSRTSPVNTQATERVTLLSSTFQNYTARMSEAVHALVESLATCVGDFVEEDRIRTEPGPVIPGISDFSSTLHFPTLASAPPIPGLGPGSWSASPVVSWASLTSVKVVNDSKSVPQGIVTNVSRSRLSKSETIMGIENTRRMMIAMMSWAADMKTHGDGLLSERLEAEGKLSIQIVKLMTSCMPSLLYLDAFLCNNSTSTSTARCSPRGNTVEMQIAVAPKKDVNNDIVDQITNNASALKGDGAGDGDEYRCVLPSGVLIKCYTLDIISVSSLSFILTATSRQSTLNYYTSCKHLPLLRVILPPKILDFIGRCYLVVYREKGAKTDMRKITDLCSDLSLAAHAISVGLTSSNCDWCKVQSNLRAVQIALDTDTMNIIVRLSS